MCGAAACSHRVSLCALLGCLLRVGLYVYLPPLPQVLYRLYLAEKLKEPFRKGSRRPDAALLAARDATRLEAQQVRPSPSACTAHTLAACKGTSHRGCDSDCRLHPAVGMTAAGMLGGGRLLGSRDITSRQHAAVLLHWMVYIPQTCCMPCLTSLPAVC